MLNLILGDSFGMLKWPFQGLSDLQLRNQKVTLNHHRCEFLKECSFENGGYLFANFLFEGPTRPQEKEIQKMMMNIW